MDNLGPGPHYFRVVNTIQCTSCPFQGPFCSSKTLPVTCNQLHALMTGATPGPPHTTMTTLSTGDVRYPSSEPVEKLWSETTNFYLQ